jgi:hypothetical protein
MNFKEWKDKNFYRLLWDYLMSSQSFEDWDSYCIQRWNQENKEIRLS